MKRKISEHFLATASKTTSANEELLRRAAEDKVLLDSSTTAVPPPPPPPTKTLSSSSSSSAVPAAPLPSPRSRAAKKAVDGFEPLVASPFTDETMRLVFAADPLLLTKLAVCAVRLADRLIVDVSRDAGVTLSQMSGGSTAFARAHLERDAFALYETHGRAHTFVLFEDQVRRLASLTAGTASIELIERASTGPTRLIVRLRNPKRDELLHLDTADNDESDAYDLSTFPHAFRVTLDAKALERLVTAAEKNKATIVSMSLDGERLSWHAGTVAVPAQYTALTSVEACSTLIADGFAADLYQLTIVQLVCGFTSLATSATLSFGRATAATNSATTPLHIHFAFADARIVADVLVGVREDV